MNDHILESFHPKKKFESKVLVWIAGSEKGVSKPYVAVTDKCSITAKSYIANCLKPKLLPFLQKHHADGKYVFWPDKASSHYATKTTDFFKAKNVNFVDKAKNPANVPQCRAIEDFWAILAWKVYEGGFIAFDCENLKSRINWALRNLDEKVATRTFASTRKRVRLCARKGPYAVVH